MEMINTEIRRIVFLFLGHGDEYLYISIIFYVFTVILIVALVTGEKS